MNLETEYMGLKLKNPIVPSASPLSTDPGMVKRLEDAGASAIVMYSLFEEQITHEQHAIDHFLSHGSESYAESLSYFPEPEAFANLEAEEYLEHLSRLKDSVSIPVIGSLNGVSAGGWMNYAKKMQQAGADAIELNIYYIPTDEKLDARQVEDMYLEDLKTVKTAVDIPVAMKLSPFFTNMANMAKRLDQAGVDGLVLFNRFYEPDIDLEDLSVKPSLQLSVPYEARLPLQWIALLKGRLKCSLAATSGIHTFEDVLKMTLAGADVTMMASALLQHGPGRIKEILDGLTAWLDKKEYNSLNQLKGSMSYRHVAEPAAYERANYMKTLQSYRQPLP